MYHSQEGVNAFLFSTSAHIIPTHTGLQIVKSSLERRVNESVGSSKWSGPRPDYLNAKTRDQPLGTGHGDKQFTQNRDLRDLADFDDCFKQDKVTHARGCASVCSQALGPLYGTFRAHAFQIWFCLSYLSSKIYSTFFTGVAKKLSIMSRAT